MAVPPSTRQPSVISRSNRSHTVGDADVRRRRHGRTTAAARAEQPGGS